MVCGIWACQQDAYDDYVWSESDKDLLLSELNRTTRILNDLTRDLTMDQWHFRENSSRWSITEVVEHLEMQNQLHYREFSVGVAAPPRPEYLPVTFAADSNFIKYATSPTQSPSRWFLEPKGKFCQGGDALIAFNKARGALALMVLANSTDLRRQMTFRNDAGSRRPEEVKIGDVRDLHQLILTGIAHTDRHLLQIQQIQAHPDYPR